MLCGPWSCAACAVMLLCGTLWVLSERTIDSLSGVVTRVLSDGLRSELSSISEKPALASLSRAGRLEEVYYGWTGRWREVYRAPSCEVTASRSTQGGGARAAGGKYKRHEGPPPLASQIMGVRYASGVCGRERRVLG